MDRFLESDMLRARPEPGLNNPPVRLKPDLQARLIGFAANKTRVRMRQLAHAPIGNGTHCDRQGKSPPAPVREGLSQLARLSHIC